MKNFKSIKKWSWRIFLFSMLLTAVSFIWVDHEIKRMWGAHTNVVDHTLFSTLQEKIVIKNVAVLSSDGLNMLSERMVVIDQGQIKSIGTEHEIPTGARVIDGKDKYLIPGLIDSHVHLWQSPNDLLLYVANGVTHIRELNGSDEHLRWKQEINQGRLGPDMFVASSRFNSNGLLKGLIDRWAAKISSVNAWSEAEDLVRSYVDKGYDAIKIYTFLSEDDFMHVSSAAEKMGIPILGHIPITIGFKKFWNSGLKELAHTEEVVKELNREFGGYNDPNAADFLEFVEARSDQISERLWQNNVAVGSTLSLMESFTVQKSNLISELQQVELSYVNPGISEGSPLAERVMGWLPDSNIYRLTSEHTDEQLMANKIYWDTYAKANQVLLKSMAQKGVKILAGTDANVPTMVPGFSIHDELSSLTEVGMTNAQALQSATAIPAKWMNLKTGKIAPGYQADLLLLNHNPLAHIKNTKAIESVIINGRFIGRKKLDELLNAVKAANDESRTIDISEYN